MNLYKNLVSASISKVQFSLLHVESHTRGFGHHLDVHSLPRLHPDHQLIPLGLSIKYVSRDIIVLDPYFCFSFI